LMTNRWLAGPSPTRRLDRDRLEERVLNLLSSQNMCVLATVGSDGPLATPVRYFHLDFTVVFTAAATSPRMRNHAADARCRSPCTPRWSVRPEAEVRSCSAVPGSWPRATRTSRPTVGGAWQSDHVERSLVARSLQWAPSGWCRRTGSSTPSTGCAARGTRPGNVGGVTPPAPELS